MSEALQDLPEPLRGKPRHAPRPRTFAECRAGRPDVKCVRAQEFVIGGWTAPRGSRKSPGALLAGYHEDGRLRYLGLRDDRPAREVVHEEPVR